MVRANRGIVPNPNAVFKHGQKQQNHSSWNAAHLPPPLVGSGNEKPAGKLGMPLGSVPMPNGKPDMAPGAAPGGPERSSLWAGSARRGGMLLGLSSERLLRHRDWSSSRMRDDLGPFEPPLSVCMRLLIALEETPAPISMSGSSTTMPLSMGWPPLPPYGAVSIHLRSASVSL